MTSACRLKPIEGHLLLILATYANSEAKAWPLIRTLTIECGRTPTKNGGNSAVSAALNRLESLELVWKTPGGKGQPATRELLFDPEFPLRPGVGWEALPSTDVDSLGALESTGVDSIDPLAIHGGGHGASTDVDTEEPLEEPHQRTKQQEPESNPQEWIPSHPVSGMEEERQTVRLAIVESLDSASRGAAA